ncbi:hypothetical protein [Streptomyces nigrescens]|uniref:hypothetical protein n=1 Tax=Streptomyces nigrescens TaxID=1920 RepID=UPI00348A5FA6
MSRHADAAPHSTGRPDRHPGKDTEDARTAVTVFVALGANLVIALAKLAGGLDSEEVLVRLKSAIRARWPIADQVFLDVTDASPKDRERARRERQQLDETVAAGRNEPETTQQEDAE